MRRTGARRPTSEPQLSRPGADPADHDDRRIVRRGLAVLSRSIHEQRASFAVALTGAVLYAAATVAQARVIGAVTDRVVVPASQDGRLSRAGLAVAALVVVGVGVLKALGVLGRRVAAYHMQRRQEADYRIRVAARMTRLPLSWHRRHSTGELLSNADADIRSAFASIAPLPLSLGVVALLVIAAISLVVTDPWLALVAVTAAPLISVVNWRYNARMHGPATRGQRQRAAVAAVAHESFEAAVVVKTLGREAQETDRFAAASESLRDELVEVGRVRARFDPVLEALPNVVVLLLLLVGALRLSAGAISAGDLAGVTYLFVLLVFPLRVIGYLLGDLPRTVVGWERVERVLDADDALAAGPQRLAGQGPARVDLEGVGFAHGDGAPVLSDVMLGVEPGRVVAVVGPTGAGKSTLASLLVRLADPTAGRVTLDGVDLRDLAADEMPRHAAIVPQRTFLFDDTVRGNLTLGADVGEAELERAARLAQLTDVVAGLPDGWDTVIGEGGTTLSGGQRQRLALARALVRDPRLLVLDDATSSVDPAIEHAILTGLREARLPATVVVVASRRATISLADEVVLVADGRVVDRGTHDELMARSVRYADLLTAYDRSPTDGARP